MAEAARIVDPNSVEATAWRNLQARLKAAGDPDYLRYEQQVDRAENEDLSQSELDEIDAQTRAYQQRAMTPEELAKPGVESMSDLPPGRPMSYAQQSQFVMGSLGMAGQVRPASPGQSAESAKVSAARLMLARASASKATASMARKDVPSRPSAKPQTSGAKAKKSGQPGPDGFAEGYTRFVNGRAQQVKGYHINPRRG